MSRRTPAFHEKRALALLVLLALPAGARGQGVSHSFDAATGTLDVDYAAYLSKHDLVFRAPIKTALRGVSVRGGAITVDPVYPHAMVIGTGRVGAQVWNANGLNLQVTGVDNAQQTAFSSGFVNLVTSPAMDGYWPSFEQRLRLYDGVITTKYGTDRTVTIMGAPRSEVLGIHVEDARTDVKSVTLEITLWDIKKLATSSSSMFLDIPSMASWRNSSSYAGSSGAGISRGQTDADGFGYTLAATVDGAPFTAEAVSNTTVRLTIEPTPSYTIWIANAARKNAPGGDSVAQARKLLDDVKAAGYASTLTAFQEMWHDFWRASFVQYSSSSDAGAADYLESFYYLAEYIIAGGAYATYPFQHVHGTYSAVGENDVMKWSGGYWYWNERDVYYSFLASNRVDLTDSLFNHYLRNYDAMKAHTAVRFPGAGGLWVPETTGWDGNARHTDESDWTRNLFTTGDELGQWMYLRYKYTNDSTWLSTIYPVMRDAATFHLSRFVCDSPPCDGSGPGKHYYIPSSNSHETYWNVKNALIDLVAVRAFFPLVIEASTILDQDADLRVQWQDLLDHVEPYPEDANGYLPADPSSLSDPTAGTPHNVENLTCEMEWPYGVIGLGSSEAELTKAKYNWNHRPYPFQEIWSPDAIQAARLGMGDEAYSAMKSMLRRYQSHPNGLTANTNGNFEYHGTHLSAVNESLLQSHDGAIRVFPALPTDATFLARFTLLASGGFLVSSEKEAGDVKYIGIKSLHGKPIRVVNPWGTPDVQVRLTGDGTGVTPTSLTASEIEFDTTANAVYVIERTAEPLAGTHGQITGTASTGKKSLGGTSTVLGSDPEPNPPWPPPSPSGGCGTLPGAGLGACAALLLLALRSRRRARNGLSQ